MVSCSPWDRVLHVEMWGSELVLVRATQPVLVRLYTEGLSPLRQCLHQGVALALATAMQGGKACKHASPMRDKMNMYQNGTIHYARRH